MHKSGTTLLSKTLSASGIEMGCITSCDYDNKGGQFECPETQSLNMELLKCSQSTFSLDVYKPVRLNELNKEQIKKMSNLIDKFNRRYRSDWGFKDPRTCLLWDSWIHCIPTCRIVAVWRDPREVLKHYVPNRPLYKQSPSRIFRAYKTLRAWYYHNHCIIKAIEKHEESLLFNYASFMKNRNSINKLQAFLGVELRDLRANHMYRNKSSDTFLFKIGLLLCWVGGMDVLSLEGKLSDMTC